MHGTINIKKKYIAPFVISIVAGSINSFRVMKPQLHSFVCFNTSFTNLEEMLPPRPMKYFK
jgi:hypothetical protein